MQSRRMVPGSQITRANAVSDDGSVIVGYGELSDGSDQAFRWEGESFTRLDFKKARDVSADGSVIVGNGWTIGGITEGVRWEDGTLTTLGQIPGTGTYQHLHPNAVSADGSVIVGMGQNNGRRAFIWDDANGVRVLKDVLENNFNLDLAGWSLTVANDISADGSVIVGYGNNPDGNEEAWMAILDWPAADFDLDNDVDGHDFLKWQLGESPDPLSDSDLALWKDDFGYNADFDDDGDVDGIDFLKWQRGESPVPLSAGDLAAWELNFGNGPVAPVSAAAVSTPEPSTLLLASLAGLLFCSRRR
jgi:probable HAF family extracellular repeat protein